MTASRALAFGSVAERYERFRPGYPVEVFDAVVEASDSGVRTALEVGAGTGKATRLFAGRGIAVTAVEPDPAMGAILRRTTAGLPVTVLPVPFEDVGAEPQVDLLYSAAAWHWTDPGTRWWRAARLLPAGGIFACLGGPVQFADDNLEARWDAVRAQVVDDESVPGATDGGDGRAWPENELRASVWFDDVSHADLTQHDTMAADDLIGLTSTVSSFVVLDEQVRADLLRRLRALLPEQVDVRRDLVVHRAVRNRVPVD